jgi:hypothetical protein
LEQCWPCPVFASYNLAFALQLREKHGKTSVRVPEQEEYINYSIKQECNHILIKIEPKEYERIC